MFNKLTLLITFGGLFVTTVRCGTTAQGGASLAGQVTAAQNNDDKGQFITAPAVQPNSDGIPGVGSCTCVPYYLCNNGSIGTNGEGIIDIRINDGPCESYLEVCCSKDDLTEEKITPAPIL